MCSNFVHILPKERLGKSHQSLTSFQKATFSTIHQGLEDIRSSEKEYTLIVVTESHRQRILLGKKIRGFGTGFYNSFGGKIELNESPDECAVRELFEETNIRVDLKHMQRRKVGTLYFTFDDNSMNTMKVHLFHVNVRLCKEDDREGPSNCVDADNVTASACDEIIPEWFENWRSVPLQEMFADDSIWLTILLESLDHENEKTSAGGNISLQLDGWFHFHPGGTDVNSIMHYFVDVKDVNVLNPSTYSLEKRLFHDIHRNMTNLSIKEFKECWAVANAVKDFYGKNSFDTVIDVAGGHGALAAMLLITTSCQNAIVVDPARGQDVASYWGKYFQGKSLKFRHECLRTGLRDELDQIFKNQSGTDKIDTTKKHVVVVACHACQHLSDETLSIACSYGAHTAVMPCCQKDQFGGSFKAFGKSVGIEIAPLMDILLAGKVMSWNTGREAGVRYHVKMKAIDKSITPQNRLILCKAISLNDSSTESERIEYSHAKLKRAYNRAHE